MANSYKINKKDKLILKELLENPSGMRAITLKKLTNIKEKTLYNHLQKLKKEKLIENIFPIWRLCQNQIPSSKVAELLQSSKIIQGHKFSFKLDLIRKPNWWEKRGNRLIKLKEYQFKINKEVKWGNNPYQQLKKDNFLIHIFKNSIFFINQKKYFGDDPYLCFQEALLDTLEALRYLEERIKFKFYLDESPQFSLKTGHLVKLKDEIANRCKKRGKGFDLEINGELRAWVDFSEPFGTEFGNKDYEVEDTERYKNFVGDIIQNNPPTQSQMSKNQAEIGQGLKILTNAVSKQAEMNSGLPIVLNKLENQIKSHLKLIQEYRKENISWRKNKIKEIRKDLKYGRQTKLRGWF